MNSKNIDDYPEIQDQNTRINIVKFTNLVNEYKERKKELLNQRNNWNRNFIAENETLGLSPLIYNNNLYNMILEIRVINTFIISSINSDDYAKWLNNNEIVFMMDEYNIIHDIE